MTDHCKLKIINEKGLHARASAKLVEVVEAFDARAEVVQGWCLCVRRQHHGTFDVGSVQRKLY